MKILISAYACEPGKGSEPEAGWLWARAAARYHDVWVLTRANNRGPIEASAPPARMTFVYLDLPRALRVWKRGGRGTRLYYVFWQLLAGLEARRLHRRERFDVVHHLTFANMWLPALACLAPAPFLLGPVGGGQRVPRRLYGVLGRKASLTERALLLARRLSRLNPLVRVAWRRAAVILVNNEETALSLPDRARPKARLRPHACVELRAPARSAPNASPVAMYAGRLNRFKGVELALDALTLLPDWRLVVAGSGPDRDRLERRARALQIDARVSFRGTLPREQLWVEMAAADAFVFPSLKEGAPFVVLEALALGTPVVAFDVSGPAALAQFHEGARIELVAPGGGARGLAWALERVASDPRPSPRAGLGVDHVARDLDGVYREIGLGSQRTSPEDRSTESRVGARAS